MRARQLENIAVSAAPRRDKRTIGYRRDCISFHAQLIATGLGTYCV
jgi:hypothetical protein